MDRYRKEFWQKDLSDVAFFRTVACVIWASLGATVPVRFLTYHQFARKIQNTFPRFSPFYRYQHLSF
jgi:hypothetical protein